MKKPKIDPDEMLESLAAEAVKQRGTCGRPFATSRYRRCKRESLV
jgi:hypothetical protein